MITNNGKDLVAKYLLGQAPQYATHISIGCGAVPLDADDVVSNQDKEIIRQKEVMDFEMARLPITSKGLVEENGTVKIAFSAELPTANRYDITEIGLWSAGRNNLATNSDSKMIFNFSEAWEKHAQSIDPIPLLQNIGTAGDISTEETIFSVSSNDITLRNSSRSERKEGPRYLNNAILVRGDTSKINAGLISITSATSNGSQIVYTATNSLSPGDVVSISGCSNKNFNIHNAVIYSATSSTFTVLSGIDSDTSNGGAAWEPGTWEVDTISGQPSTHIHLNNINLGIDSNSPIDKLKLALSLISKTALSGSTPGFVKILIEFYKNEIATSSGYAKAEVLLSSADFISGNYAIAEIPISNLITTTDFSSSQIRVCRIFISIVDSSDQLQDDFYIALDGFRIDNISTVNPLYRMSGYSIVKIDGKPITKFQNTNNYIEFRLALGIT